MLILFDMKPHSQTPLPICLPQISMVILLLLSSISLQVIKADAGQAIAPIALPGCQHICGNVRIPFPFGIGANCSLDANYEIECKPFPASNSSIRPILSKFNVEVVEIVLDVDDLTGNLVRTMKVNIPPMKVCTADTQRERLSSTIDLRGSPYNFSISDHVLIMKGCAGSTVLVDQSEKTIAGCSTVCYNSNNTAIPRNKCYGVEYCQMQLSSTTTTPPLLSTDSYSLLQFYHIDFYGQSSGGRQNCMTATLMKNDVVNQYVGKLLSSPTSSAPIVLFWSWVSSRWPDYNTDRAKCFRDELTNITLCLCKRNHFGNPYVLDGCQVPDACRQCHGVCIRGGDHFYCEEEFRQSTNILNLKAIITSVIRSCKNSKT